MVDVLLWVLAISGAFAIAVVAGALVWMYLLGRDE